jgi:hypothetical protein
MGAALDMPTPRRSEKRQGDSPSASRTFPDGRLVTLPATMRGRRPHTAARRGAYARCDLDLRQLEDKKL